MQYQADIKEFTMGAFGIIGMALGATGFIYGLIAFLQMERLRGRITHLESEFEKLKVE